MPADAEKKPGGKGPLRTRPCRLPAGRAGAQSAALALLCCLVFLALPGPAQSDDWRTLPWQDLPSALAAAGKDQRPVLIFFEARWCYLCREMRERVFSHRVVGAALRRHFHLVRADVSRHQKLKQRFKVNFLPYTLLLAPDGRTILRVKSYIPRQRFLKILRFVHQGHYRKMDLATWEKRRG